jgi:hypothetical protein
MSSNCFVALNQQVPMSRRYWIFLLLLVGVVFGHSAPVRAQCMPFKVLDQTFAGRFVSVDSVAKLLSAKEWVFHDGDSPYWTHREAGSSPPPPTQARLELRRTSHQAYYDLVYKTTRHACLAQLRTHLRRNNEFVAQYVNCLQCDGERLVGYGYTITIINQRDSYAAKRVQFPYVLVMRRTTGDTRDSEEITPELSQLLSAP